jgi:hypothetical protein
VSEKYLFPNSLRKNIVTISVGVAGGDTACNIFTMAICKQIKTGGYLENTRMKQI